MSDKWGENTIEQRALLRRIKDLNLSEGEIKELIKLFLFIFDLTKEK